MGDAQLSVDKEPRLEEQDDEVPEDEEEVDEEEEEEDEDEEEEGNSSTPVPVSIQRVRQDNGESNDSAVPESESEVSSLRFHKYRTLISFDPKVNYYSLKLSRSRFFAILYFFPF